MKLGIDLHNIRDGGGINYVSNLLKVFRPGDHGFSAICVFGSADVLAQMPSVPHVEKRVYPLLARSLPFRLYFLFFMLPRELRRTGCDLLYSPGGLYFGSFRPFATISRNMMPFQKDRWGLYAVGFDRLRLHLLSYLNAASFRRADKMIYLSHHAAGVIGGAVGQHRGPTAVIAHGINRRIFQRPPETPLPTAVNPAEAIRLVYPSRLEPYKHQVEVIHAMLELRREFPAITLDLYGPANPTYLKSVQELLAREDPAGQVVRYHGMVPNAQLPGIYAQHHALLFASSCENLPNILIEAFEFGIPVICSSAAPMPEIAGACCTYFDPERVASIVAAVRACLGNWPATLDRMQQGRRLAANYSWERCADQTFAFLSSPSNAAPAIHAP